MTDIRKCAQAVIDKWKTDGVLLDWVYEDVELIEALAEPVEPVAWQYRVVFRLTGEDSLRHGRWHECRDKDEYDDYKSRHWFEVRELYTTPPSVDALIAEIDGLLVLEELGFQSAIKISDIKAILDKYRSVK